MIDEGRDNLIGNITAHLSGAQRRIQLRQTALFFKADPDYGRRLAEGLGLDVKEVERLAGNNRSASKPEVRKGKLFLPKISLLC